MNICQRCHARNADFALRCAKCGAELTPPVVPHQYRDEVNYLLDDADLERISTLEFSLKSSEKNLEELVGYLEKQFLNNLYLSISVEKIIDALEQRGVLERKELERRVRDELKGQLFGHDQRQDLARRLQPVAAGYRGPAPQFKRFIRLAVPLLYTARHRQGVRLLEQALALDAENEGMLRVLAELHFIAGRQTSARRCLERLIRLHPAHGPANLMMGLIQLKRGRFGEARAHLEVASSRAPRAFAPQFLLGVAHFLGEDFKSSGRTFRTAYQARPLPQISLLSSVAYYLGDATREAAAGTRKVPPRLGRSAFFHFLSGLIERRRRQERRADRHFEQAVRHNPRWEPVIEQVRRSDPAEARRTEVKIFTSRMHREMESLMGLLISEIQSMEP
jgi:tetratricopeptide (TPR) repeat protein